MNRFFQPAITAVLLSAALVVIAVTLLSGSVAQGAATYIKTDGTIVDPIMDIYGSPHPYSGLWAANNDLEPSASAAWANLADAYLNAADLEDANLWSAKLNDADLTDANLTNATLTIATLDGANLTGSTISESQFLSAASVTAVNLTGHTMSGWDLTGADLTNANLSSADLTSATFSLGTTLYDGQTVLQHGFDTAGLQAYLEASPFNASSAANIIIVDLVPEPHTLLLASLASMGLTLRRRRSAR